MNRKASSFNKYLKEKEIVCFNVEEIADDPLKTVVFRSFLTIDAQQLPTIVILDNSVYGIIRVLIAKNALNEKNELNLLRRINEFNRTYKAFKYYFDEEGSLILDCSILLEGYKASGSLIYTMFDVMVKHLNQEYKELMRLIWE